MPFQNIYNANVKEESKKLLLREVVRDEESFKIYFKNNFKSLCYYCHLKFGLDIEEAKEAVHVSFIKLWENREKFPAGVLAGAYLHPMA